MKLPLQQITALDETFWHREWNRSEIICVYFSVNVECFYPSIMNASVTSHVSLSWMHFVGCTSTVIAYVDPVQWNTGWQWHDWTKIALLLSFLQQTDRERKTINTYFLSESVHWATPQGHPVGILWLFMCIFFTHYCNLVSWEKWIYPSLIQIKSHGNHS